MMDIEQIKFDADDQALFGEKELLLKAEALRESILPRMAALMTKAMNEASLTYGIDIFDNSILSRYPNFRPSRQTPFTENYEQAFVGIGGERKAGIWNGVTRKGGVPVTIVPFRFGFLLNEDGLRLDAHHTWLKGLDPSSQQKYVKFYRDNADIIQKIFFLIEGSPLVHFLDHAPPLAPLKQMYQEMRNERIPDCDFQSRTIPYPIGYIELDQMIANFVTVYPIYDSLIRISMGKRIRFHALVQKTNAYLIERESRDPLQPTVKPLFAKRRKTIAEDVVKVRYGLRWRVLSRDNWRCVACGASGKETTLHMDHKIPRSKGGTEDISNLQTFCAPCNLGKSNRDSTDFHKKHQNSGPTLQTKP